MLVVNPGYLRYLGSENERGGGKKRKEEKNILITRTPHKRLRSILGPQVLAREMLRLPSHLVHDLRNRDGMAGRTGSRGSHIIGFRSRSIGHMAHMIWRIRILAIPTGREGDDGADAADARFLGEGLGIGTAAVDVSVVARLGHASMTNLARTTRRPRLARSVTDEHAETGLECRDGIFGIIGGDL